MSMNAKQVVLAVEEIVSTLKEDSNASVVMEDLLVKTELNALILTNAL
jgi:acyl CoA:acetate/3-ketoacid CoA transferase alpha subunit